MGVADPPPHAASPADERAVLPSRTVGVGIGGLVGAIAFALAVALVVHAFVTQWVPAVVVASEAALWSVLLATCRGVSRRYGSGELGRDFGLAARPRDIWRGFGYSWLARLVALVVAIPLLANRRLIASNTGTFKRVNGDAAGIVVVGLIAAVGAPIVEELFFRGLMLRAFQTRLGGRGAVFAQAALFASAHLNPYLGLGNVSIFVTIGAIGVTFGFVAQRWRRLGPSMAAHGFFNLFSLLFVLALRP